MTSRWVKVGLPPTLSLLCHKIIICIIILHILITNISSFTSSVKKTLLIHIISSISSILPILKCLYSMFTHTFFLRQWAPQSYRPRLCTAAIVHTSGEGFLCHCVQWQAEWEGVFLSTRMCGRHLLGRAAPACSAPPLKRVALGALLLGRSCWWRHVWSVTSVSLY